MKLAVIDIRGYKTMQEAYLTRLSSALLEKIKSLVKSCGSVSGITRVSDEGTCFSIASVQLSL